MKRNTSPRPSPTSVLRPALELLEQRLVMDNTLGEIVSSQPAVIELSVSADLSPSLDVIPSDPSPMIDHDSLELLDADTDETHAKDVAELSATTDDAFLNFELIAGPFPNADDPLTAYLPTAPQPPDNPLDEFHLDLGLPDYDWQNKHTLSPIEPADKTNVDRSVESESSKVRGWSPLEAPVVIQMPTPPIGLLAAELPTRLPDSIHNQPLIPRPASPVVGLTLAAPQTSGVMKRSSLSSRETDFELHSSKLKSAVEELQTTVSDGLDGLTLVEPGLRVSPSAAFQLSPEAYFDPQASLQRAPMVWTSDTSAIVTRKHAALESSSVVLLADSANTTTPVPTNHAEAADDEKRVDPTLGYFSDLVTNAFTATRLASGLLLQGITSKKTPSSNDSELLPAVITDFLIMEFNPHTPATQQGSQQGTQQGTTPVDPSSTSWSEVLVLIVAGLLLPAYMQEPRVRNV